MDPNKPKNMKQSTISYPVANSQPHESLTPRNKRGKNEMIESSPLTLESMKDELADIKAAMSKSEDSIIQKLLPLVTNAFTKANADLLNMLEKKLTSSRPLLKKAERQHKKFPPLLINWSSHAPKCKQE